MKLSVIWKNEIYVLAARLKMIDIIGIDTASLENVLWKQIMVFVILQADYTSNVITIDFSSSVTLKFKNKPKF